MDARHLVHEIGPVGLWKVTLTLVALALFGCQGPAPGHGASAHASLDDEAVLSAEEAACLGLTDPVCAGCHMRGEEFVLRPRGVPPPPPDVALVASPADCVEAPDPEPSPEPEPTPEPSDEGEITADQAACLGLTEPACAGCHQRGERWVLRPLGVPPPPDVATVPSSACL